MEKANGTSQDSTNVPSLPAGDDLINRHMFQHYAQANFVLQGDPKGVLTKTFLFKRVIRPSHPFFLPESDEEFSAHQVPVWRVNAAYPLDFRRDPEYISCAQKWQLSRITRIEYHLEPHVDLEHSGFLLYLRSTEDSPQDVGEHIELHPELYHMHYSADSIRHIWSCDLPFRAHRYQSQRLFKLHCWSEEVFEETVNLLNLQVLVEFKFSNNKDHVREFLATQADDVIFNVNYYQQSPRLRPPVEDLGFPNVVDEDHSDDDEGVPIDPKLFSELSVDE